MYGQIDFTKLKPGNYNRKSSEDDDRQILSVSSQIDEAKRIADFYKLAPFVEIFQESKSAKIENNRPEYTRMMSMIKGGQMDSIVCWKLDRIARNMTEGGEIIDLLSSGVIKAIITHDKVYYPWDNVIMMAVEFSQGKQFIKDLSVNVKRGQKKKASMGVPHGIAALGFLNDRTEEKGNRKWKVDEERLWKIKKLFDMFLTGTYSAGKLYRYAVEELKLTTVERKRSGGRLIVLSRIYALLKDSIYVGYFNYGGERYELDSSLPRIITETERERVLQLLSNKNIPKIKHHQTLYSTFLHSEEGDFMGQDIKFQLICDCKNKFAYRDKTHCPKCSKEIEILENPKYLVTSYYYNVRKKKSRLQYKSLNEAVITAKLKSYVSDNLSFSNSLLAWSKKYIHELKDKDVSDGVLMSQDKAKRTEEFELKKRKTRDMLRDGKITDPEYQSDLASLVKEYADTQKEQKAVDWYSEMIEITDIVEKLQNILEKGTLQAKREILSRLGSNLVWNDEVLDIHCRKSIETLVEGIKRIRIENPKFEPKKYVVPQGLNKKTEPFDPVFSSLLRV